MDEKITHILGLLWQIIRLILMKSVNLKSHPQLIRLLKEGELMTDLLKLHPEDLLLRWFNFHLENAGHPDKITNFTGDLKDSDKYLVLLNQLNKQCSLSTMKETDLTKKANSVLQNAQKINVESYIKPKDITEGNKKLNVLFVASIFNECHGLDPLTKEEEFEAAKLLDDDVEGTREERSFRLWMNSLNIDDGAVHFNNLYEDCKDGNLLLKVIDRVSPGSVNWKHVDDKPNNIFKKKQNCNVAIDSMKKGGFKAPGIGGGDIYDGNKKLTLALIWQLMRSHSLQVVGGKTEKDMVAWGNSISGCNTTSLSDKTIKDSLWFIKIMNGIESRAINWDLVNQGGKKLIFFNFFIFRCRTFD
jgi:plastin-1